LREDEPRIKQILLGHLEQLVTEKEVSGKKTALQLLNQMVLQNDEFDLAIIRLLRRITYNFLILNEDFELHETPLLVAIMAEADNMTMEQYRNNIVLKNGEDARNLVFSIVPLVLRIRITTVLFDLKAISNESFIQTYGAKAPKFNYFLKDSLNLHHEQLSILLKPGHYDALYSTDFIKQNPLLLQKDMAGIPVS
jgi:hypothetical protein